MSARWEPEEERDAIAARLKGSSFADIADLLNLKYGTKRSVKAVKTKLTYSPEEASKKKETELGSTIDYQEFVNELLTAYGNMEGILKSPQIEDVFHGKLEETAVLHLSDVHQGKVNWFTDLETNAGYETYNEKIMYAEMDRLVEAILSVNLLLAQSYTLKELYIFATGDLLDNDLIVRGQRFFVDVGVGLQTVKAQRLFEDFTLQMLRFFERVHWRIIPGNHGRMTQQREKAPYYNNFDWLLAQMLALAFRNEPRVTVESPESWFGLYKIYGWRYFLHHGDTVYSWMGIPYYGLQRQGKSRRTEVDMDIELIGHFHQQMEIPISSKSYTLVSGCWIEKDDWGWQKYGVFSKPEQRYFGVSPKRPRTWSFNLDLRPRKAV